MLCSLTNVLLSVVHVVCFNNEKKNLLVISKVQFQKMLHWSTVMCKPGLFDIEVATPLVEDISLKTITKDRVSNVNNIILVQINRNQPVYTRISAVMTCSRLTNFRVRNLLNDL